jgi:hypothetical protein
MSLWADFLTNSARRVHKWKHYFPAYERHMSRFVNHPVTILEIGCGEGGSLQLWKRFLGPHARIVGIDIKPACAAFEEDQISVRIGPQEDTAFLQRVVDEFGAPDIVLDDGSHIMSHILTTFGFLYPRTARNGVYIVEDLHTAYWPEYEGGLRSPNTFIEVAKALVDELNADHTRGALRPTPFTHGTLSMHFCDSLLVFERGTHTRKWAPCIGRRFPPGGQESTEADFEAGRQAGPEWAQDKSLAQLYHAARTRPSDINEHLPTLYELASRCRHVTEFGTRKGVSTTALLFAQPEKLVCYDVKQYPQVLRLQALAAPTRFDFHKEDVLKAEIEETDLLFIDTWHVYEQLREELRRHADKVRRYIVLHDTTTYGERGQAPGSRGLWPAVEEFLARGTFRLKERRTNNNGLTVLEAVPA